MASKVSINTMNDYQLLTFEVLPIERVSPIDSLGLTGFADALGRIGIAKATKKGDIATFSVCDQKLLKEKAKRCLEDDEFVWLAVDYFEELIIGKGNENIIFAIASKKVPEIKGPWERSAYYVSSLVGEMIYPICANLRDKELKTL